ncbi:MAG: peptidase [Gammaproteobacteria bacterium]|nr:peptidase [Gammaproteobacteria bacterium]MCP5137069.1 peptidase [Gammaproteobacteria bacterium]
MLTKQLIPVLALVAGLGAAPVMATVDANSVVRTYVDIAQATFEDALIAAHNLELSVDQLIATPNEVSLAAARAAWRAARVPYQQTEVFRFGNPEVDAWEGRLNSWPLDEGLIDYVDADSYGEESDENPYYGANIIANPRLKVGGRVIDAGTIDKALIADTLNEIDGIESNVARGYHAIEFLLWGQDLNDTGPGAGNRPGSDFDPKHCTGGHCDRRAAYLKAATALLIDDLAEMSAAWSAGGAIRARIDAAEPRTTLAAMLTGMGSLSYGELAGERMKLGLMLHDPEEEHDCFSDNTHWSHFYDVRGMRNVYLGHYRRIDGRNVGGASLSDLVAASAAQADADMRARLDTSNARFQALVDAAERGESYDQLIGAGNKDGNAIVRAAIDALLDQAKAIEGVIAALDLDAIQFEGSDSLDSPDKVGN